MKKSDEVLIELFKNGEAAAFDELFHRYEKRMYDLAFRLSHSDADAKDAVQETFLSVYHSINSLREPKYFSLWIRKILLSKIKQIFAKNKTVTIPDDDYRLIKQEESNMDFVPEQYIHFSSDRLQLQDFVNELPLHYREVLLLTYFEQMKNHEIAEVLELPLGTVKSRLNMARKILKTQIETYEKENQVKLDFKEDVLAGAIAGRVGLSYLRGSKNAPKQFLASIAQGSFSTIVQAVLCVTILAGGTMAVVAVGRNHASQAEQLPNAVSHNYADAKPVNKQEQAYFTPVTVQDITYETPYQVYQGLKKFMHCEYEMAQATQAEKDQMYLLYDALKQEHGVYYTLLQKQGWVESFEQLSNH